MHKIKLLFFIRTYYGGGVERSLLDYITNIDKNKFDITIITTYPEGAYANDYLSNKTIKCKTTSDVLLSKKGVFSRAYNHFLYKMIYSVRWSFPKLFYKFCLKGDYDIEIAYMHNESAVAIANSTNKHSVKIGWVHTDFSVFDGWKQYYKNQKELRKVYNKFDMIVCVSENVRINFSKITGINKGLTVLYNPVDRNRVLNMSTEPVNLPFNLSLPIICAVGRLSFEKQFDILIKAHASLIKKGLNHYLIIVGDGNEKDNLNALIDVLGVCDTVFMIGYKSNPYPYMKAADFSVCSSKYEGLPISSQESIILGKPVVSTCPVVAEMFGGYECGLITENSEKGLTDGIEKLLVSPEMLNRMKYNCQKQSVNINIKKSVSEAEKLFYELYLQKQKRKK